MPDLLFERVPNFDGLDRGSFGALNQFLVQFFDAVLILAQELLLAPELLVFHLLELMVRVYELKLLDLVECVLSVRAFAACGEPKCKFA